VLANRLLGGLEDTNFLTVFNLETNAVSLVGFTIENGDVGNVQGRLFLDDTTLNTSHRVRFGMALDEVDAADDQTIVSQHCQHLATLALVFGGDDDDLVVTTNLLHDGFSLQHFGGERDDLHELLGTQFTSHRPEDTGADRLLLVVQQNSSVAVEADDRAIGTAYAVTGADHDSSHHLAFLHLAARNRFLHGDLDDVADTGITTVRTTKYLDAHNATSTAVVSDVEHGLSLNHIFLRPLVLRLPRHVRRLPPGPRTWSWPADGSHGW